MTTIIMMFALPIGIIIYFWDRKNSAATERVYKAFIDQVRSNRMLSDEEKLLRIDAMFYGNGYRTVLREPKKLIVEKKFLNLGILVIAFALLNLLGVILFIIHYFYLLKPLRKEIVL